LSNCNDMVGYSKGFDSGSHSAVNENTYAVIDITHEIETDKKRVKETTLTSIDYFDTIGCVDYFDYRQASVCVRNTRLRCHKYKVLWLLVF
jgi:hypothetical protein